MIQEDKPLSDHVTRDMAKVIIIKSSIFGYYEGNANPRQELLELVAFAYEQGHADGVISAKEGRE